MCAMIKTKKKNPPKPKNLVAKVLSSPLFRKRVVESKIVYKRVKKVYDDE
jgi:stalled ribosome alternative rescue factor ArfA